MRNNPIWKPTKVGNNSKLRLLESSLMLVLLSTGKSKELKRKIAASSTVSNFLDKVSEKSV